MHKIPAALSWHVLAKHCQTWTLWLTKCTWLVILMAGAKRIVIIISILHCKRCVCHYKVYVLILHTILYTCRLIQKYVNRYSPGSPVSARWLIKWRGIHTFSFFSICVIFIIPVKYKNYNKDSFFEISACTCIYYVLRLMFACYYGVVCYKLCVYTNSESYYSMT